jgi:hypothetical protein
MSKHTPPRLILQRVMTCSACFACLRACPGLAARAAAGVWGRSCIVAAIPPANSGVGAIGDVMLLVCMHVCCVCDVANSWVLLVLWALLLIVLTDGGGCPTPYTPNVSRAFRLAVKVEPGLRDGIHVVMGLRLCDCVQDYSKSKGREEEVNKVKGSKSQSPLSGASSSALSSLAPASGTGGGKKESCMTLDDANRSGIDRDRDLWGRDRDRDRERERARDRPRSRSREMERYVRTF